MKGEEKEEGWRARAAGGVEAEAAMCCLVSLEAHNHNNKHNSCLYMG